MNIIFFDTETTGIANEDRLIQLAIKARNDEEPVLNSLYNTSVQISYEAMSVHHITQKAIADRPMFRASQEFESVKGLFEDPDTVSVAHNASFDVSMLSREGIRPSNVICTYKVARSLDPEETFSNYKLQFLRYFLEIEVEGMAHDAYGDVRVLEKLFERQLVVMIENTGSEQAAIAAMIEISARPILFSTIRFGKHRGRKISEIAQNDRGYLEWLRREKMQDPEGEADWIATLDFYLD